MTAWIHSLAFRFLELFQEWANPWYWVLLGSTFFTFGLLGWSPIQQETTTKNPTLTTLIAVYLRRTGLKALAILLVFLPFMILLAGYSINKAQFPAFAEHMAVFFWEGFAGVLGFPLIGYALGLVLSVTYARFIVPKISAIKRRFRVRQSGDELSDIRVEANRMQAKNFHPPDYYQPDAIFFGLNENGEPISIKEDTWKVQNQRYIGPTQTGKGVLIGVQLDQAIRKNHTVIFIDPKPDPYGFSIMKQACLETNREFVALDLKDEQVFPMKYELFAGGSYRDRLGRFIACAKLESTGNESDYYHRKERAILNEVFPKEPFSLRTLLGLLEQEPYQEKTGTSCSMIREMLHVRSLDVGPDEDTLNLADILRENQVLYVRSSLHDAVVKAASTMLITEVIQEVMRLKAERHSHVFLVIDEIAFLISETIADALATLTSFDAHLCLAYQSEGDLLNGHDTKINWKAVAQRVKTNSKIHLYYRAEEFDTAQIMADKSGTQVKAVTRAQRVSMGRHLEETWEGDRDIHGVEEAFIHPNVAMTLPERVGVFFQPTQTAQVLYTSWVPVEIFSIPILPATPHAPNFPTMNTTQTSEEKTPSRVKISGGLSPLSGSHTAPAPHEK
ncbi:MAG: TraM recognition domain-containing protein [Nitrospirales bacterium]|nr:TraM recognition domain-containing protein [Nitrospirales bacterium]